jgi:GntR family transcriptional regulator/MocR family aminotransferase
MELLDWARLQGAWILEDDYDGEFRFSERPVGALCGLDTNGSTIYLNGFNKVLFPALRIGFLVLPERLIEPFKAAKSIVERFPSVLEQAVLCDFFSEGYLGRHIRKMRELYSERLDYLERCVTSKLRGLITLPKAHGGLQTIGWLAAGIEEASAQNAATVSGLETIPLSYLTIAHRMPPALVLGFSSSDGRMIRQGVEILAKVLDQERRRAGSRVPRRTA